MIESIQRCFRVSSSVHHDDIFILFRITHYYNTFMGVVILLLIALPVSWLTRKDKIVDEELITPLMRWAIPKRYGKNEDDRICIEELSELNKKIQI